MTKDIDYKIAQAEKGDLCLLCKGPADKKLVGSERTFRFCNGCGTAFTALLYQMFGLFMIVEGDDF
ncbi:unnamed protein product [marine sediment metagenome]|uniref:Uncharacterized protein n=1 Tax=marine sediment metagenome TaxID=412755 RepID=X0UL54_9ZZZZ